MAGAPIGNKNGVKAKRWQQALERSLARVANGTVDDGLSKVADMVVDGALGGDKDCWQEIANRIDGKAAQSLTIGGDADNPLVISEVARKIID